MVRVSSMSCFVYSIFVYAECRHNFGIVTWNFYVRHSMCVQYVGNVVFRITVSVGP